MTIAQPASQSIPATPLAAANLSCSSLCERALRKVGAFAIYDDSPDTDEMAETLSWLDLIVKEVTGNQLCYWLRPKTVEFDWPLNERHVVLADQMGAEYPSLGIQFPVGAWLVNKDTGCREGKLELCRRERYEDWRQHHAVGRPEILYIDRLVQNEGAYIWRMPNIASTVDPTTSIWRIALEFQTYTRSVLGEQGGNQAGDVWHGFSTEWELFLITRLAAEIGDGPVQMLDSGRIRGWREYSEVLLNKLTAYANKEKSTQRPVTRRYDA